VLYDLLLVQIKSVHGSVFIQLATKPALASTIDTG